MANWRQRGVKAFTKQLLDEFPCAMRTGEKYPLQFMAEHRKDRAKMLRSAINKTGKRLTELSAAELIAINKAVDEHGDET